MLGEEGHQTAIATSMNATPPVLCGTHEEHEVSLAQVG